MIGYMRDIELKMEWLYATLSEKDRRRYAAIEVAKLGHGGTELNFRHSRLGSVDRTKIRHCVFRLSIDIEISVWHA